MNHDPLRLRFYSALLFLLGVLFLLPIFCKGETRIKQARCFLPTIVYPTGISMQPAYHEGDAIMICPVKWEDLKIGMWVEVWPAGFKRPVLHVLSSRFGPLWKTQGLNPYTNTREDSWLVTPDNLVGEAVKL